MPTRRNDPCPCGSGLKFKKCHGAAATTARRPDISPAATWQQRDHELAELLLRYARTHYSDAWGERAMDAYLGPTGADLTEDELQIAVPFVLYNAASVPARGPLADEFLRKKGHQLAPNLRVLLDAQVLTYCSLWYVERVDSGEGLALVDLLTEEARFVHERLGSETAEPGLVLLGRVADVDGLALLLGSHPQPLRVEWTESLVREARRRCRVRTRPISSAKMRDLEFQSWLVNEWRSQCDAAHAPPRISNTDGDEMCLTTDHFAFEPTAREELIAVLLGLKGAQEPQAIDDGDDAGETEIVITRAGNRLHTGWENTVIATLIMGDGRLRLMTNSTRRADALRKQVLARARALLRFRVRDETSTPYLMQQSREAAARGEPVPPRPEQTPEQSAMVRGFKAQHYATWPDIPLPALGGLTPRAALRTKRGRAQVRRLVDGLERGEANLPAAERYDVGILRAELGL